MTTPAPLRYYSAAEAAALPAMIVDSFAGGGGASTGIEIALGRSPDVAINHSADALRLHAANHPDTLHLDSNIWDVAPREVTRGRRLGLLWASPDCKHFSKAKGGAPRDRNIRDLAWVVVRWAEEVKPDVILMENVEEFLTWGPVDNDGQPIKAFAGQTFDLWVRRLKRCGYKVQWRELRACDYGAPTIRKRFFMVARRDGRPIVWPKPTHGDPTSAAVKRGKLLPWRTAAECIDWSLPCPSIFDSKEEIRAKHGLKSQRPLKPNTLARVARGMKRYVLDAERPFIVNLTHSGRVEDVADPFRTITGAHRGEKAVVAPLITRFNGGATGADLRDPMPTVTANSYIQRPGSAAPLGIIAPTLVQSGYGEAPGQAPRALDIGAPLGTVVAGGVKHALAAPHLAALKGTARRSVAIDKPHPTVLAGGGHSALVSPHLVSVAHGDSGGRREYPLTDPMGVVLAGGISNAVIAPHVMTMRNAGKPFNGADEPTHTITAGGAGLAAVIASIVGCGGRAGQSRPRGANEPMATVTAKADACVTAAFLAQHNNDGRTGAVNPGRRATAPLSTVTATGSQQSVIAPVLTYAQHGGAVRDASAPLHTVTASRKDQNGLIARWFAKYYGAGTGARQDEPAHTITVKDRLGHIEAAVAAPPFGPEYHGRARQVAAFLRDHGAWEGGEFVTLMIDGTDFVVVDIGMRMLTPRELFRAQGFPDDYVIEGTWTPPATPDGEWRWQPITNDVQVSCCGNSVCPPLAAALARANCAHLIATPESAKAEAEG
jgi:DNA (cytosine-5)-methyltransferase 1